MGILPMTLAWSYFGIWAVRFFFLWTLVYAENRNSLYNVSGHMYNSLKYEIHYKWDRIRSYVQFVETRNTEQVGWNGMAKN